MGHRSLGPQRFTTCYNFAAIPNLFVLTVYLTLQDLCVCVCGLIPDQYFPHKLVCLFMYSTQLSSTNLKGESSKPNKYQSKRNRIYLYMRTLTSNLDNLYCISDLSMSAKFVIHMENRTIQILSRYIDKLCNLWQFQWICGSLQLSQVS